MLSLLFHGISVLDWTDENKWFARSRADSLTVSVDSNEIHLLFQSPLWFLYKVLLKAARKSEEGSSDSLILSLSSLPLQAFTEEFRIDQSDESPAPHIARFLLQAHLTAYNRMMIVSDLARRKQISNNLFRVFVHEGLQSGKAYELLCVVSALLFIEERPIFSQDFCPEYIQLIPFASVILVEELYTMLSVPDAVVEEHHKELLLISLRLEDRHDELECASTLSITDWIKSNSSEQAEIECKKVRLNLSEGEGVVDAEERERNLRHAFEIISFLF